MLLKCFALHKPEFARMSSLFLYFPIYEIISEYIDFPLASMLSYRKPSVST